MRTLYKTYKDFAPNLYFSGQTLRNSFIKKHPLMICIKIVDPSPASCYLSFGWSQWSFRPD